MAIIAETIAPLGTSNEKSGYRQTIQPNIMYGEYVANDTDDHAFHVDGRGKGRMTISVENPSNKDVVVTVYGAHAIDADVGDAGVFELGGSGVSVFTALATDRNYECYNDPFPFFIINCTSADTPDGETVIVYITLEQQ